MCAVILTMINWPSTYSTLLAALVVAFVLTSCGSTPQRTAPDPEPSATPTIPANLRVPPGQPVSDPRRVLALVPEDAEVLTITDFDAVRARFGVDDLSSDDLMTDRSAFWEQASRESVLLTDGLLREDGSRFMLDHGFTQDDVDWEARFTGPGGAGYVVAFRPGLDMARVRGALKDKQLRKTLAGAEVLAGEHLLVKGVAEAGAPVWAMDADLAALTEVGAESTYLQKSCVPVRTALGPDATFEDQDALVARQDPTFLRPLDGFSVSFSDRVATARLGLDRIDLHDRADLTEVWPETGPVDFGDAFEGLAVADPPTGRIGLQVADPAAAAGLTLAERLPFAVCNEVEPFEEPTGL
jgi:hypothetical protein